MARSFLPTTDAGLLAWSANFANLIVDSPVEYGVTAEIAAAYAAKQSAYRAALAAAMDPGTRGNATVLAKELAKSALLDDSRNVAGQVRGTIAVTDQQRQALGLIVRKQRSPIPPPREAPVIQVLSVDGRTVRFRLRDGSSSKRGKPAYVAGASVFSFVGDTPPAETGNWKFESSATRTELSVMFSTSLPPGATVWLTAYWFNPRGQAGPMARAVSRTFGAAGMGPSPNIKIAA